MIRDSRAYAGATVTKPQIRIILGLPPNASVGNEWVGKKLSGVIRVYNKLNPKQEYSMPEQEVNMLLMRQRAQGYNNQYEVIKGFNYGNALPSLQLERNINVNNMNTFSKTINELSMALNDINDITALLGSVTLGPKPNVMAAQNAASYLRRQGSGMTKILSDLARQRQYINLY